MGEEIISKELVKPSSPTPNHLKIHKLSSLDQIAPPVYVPLIFFYRYQKSHELLKQSLSVTLTRFPPLAGRIQENSFIDCNDEGAEFIESIVHSRLDQLILNPQMETLKKLLPMQPLLPDHAANPILAVKISSFDCGGISVGVCLSHKIADGTSLVDFIKTWSAMSNELIPIPNPNPNTVFAVDYFPPMDLSGSKITPNIGVSNEKITTKRLVFDREKLAKLKQIAAICSEIKNPSRVEAVSSFIWGHFIETAAKTKTLFVGVHAVSLRARASPPIPEDVLGNCWSASFAYLEKECRDLVRVLRASIRVFDEGCVEKVRSGEYLRGLSEMTVDLFGRETEICSFSSWCRFPVYEVDFGWGKPEWVCTTTLPFKNLVILMSTPAGDGIEAWVNLPERDVQMLERRYSSITC